jgi:hypothetical protein
MISTFGSTSPIVKVTISASTSGSVVGGFVPRDEAMTSVVIGIPQDEHPPQPKNRRDRRARKAQERRT